MGKENYRFGGDSFAPVSGEEGRYQVYVRLGRRQKEQGGRRGRMGKERNLEKNRNWENKPEKGKKKSFPFNLSLPRKGLGTGGKDVKTGTGKLSRV